VREDRDGKGDDGK